MNERIKQLIAQAGGIGHDDDGNELTPALVGKSLEKFAELIVRECADVMDGRDENGNAKDGQYLLTKFGIDASQRYT